MLPLLALVLTAACGSTVQMSSTASRSQGAGLDGGTTGGLTGTTGAAPGSTGGGTGAGDTTGGATGAGTTSRSGVSAPRFMDDVTSSSTGAVADNPGVP